MVPLWNIHCSKQIPHLLTAVYSLETLTLGNQYIFTPIICSSRWALGINFFCIHPIGKNYKIEHFSSKSSPNPRNTQRTSDFPMVWWLPIEISTAVYSLKTLTLGNEYIFTHSICSSRWAPGINFFCIHPISKNYKIEHFSSKSRPNPRNTQRTSDFPMVWWLPWLPFEISTAVSRSHICLLQCIVWKLWL